MADFICYACANEGAGRKIKRGSGKTEFWIYVLLLVPGPLYSIWRRIGLKRVCTQCGMQTVVKTTSDQGQIAKKRLDVELGLVQAKKPEEQKPVEGFGNERPAEKVITKKPVNPEEW